jgi:uncharacterized protein GlcG (DUF336 family)
MNTISLESVSLDAASRIAQYALSHARNHNMAPLVVAVLDVRGLLKAYLAEDGASLLRFEIASGKAWGALGMGFGGREIARRAAKAPLFINALQSLSEGRMVPVPGGVLIRNAKGEIIGAVGISGETSENDETCAVHAIGAAGLIADTGDANPGGL